MGWLIFFKDSQINKVSKKNLIFFPAGRHWSLSAVDVTPTIMTGHLFDIQSFFLHWYHLHFLIEIVRQLSLQTWYIYLFLILIHFLSILANFASIRSSSNPRSFGNESSAFTTWPLALGFLICFYNFEIIFCYTFSMAGISEYSYLI